jgi:hypothetical protein
MRKEQKPDKSDGGLPGEEEANPSGDDERSGPP